jgi:hypothetical protein
MISEMYGSMLGTWSMFYVSDVKAYDKMAPHCTLYVPTMVPRTYTSMFVSFVHSMPINSKTSP